MSKRYIQIQETLYCGIDVSAKSLAVAILRVGQPVEQTNFPNNAKGHNALIVWLRKAKSQAFQLVPHCCGFVAQQIVLNKLRGSRDVDFVFGRFYQDSACRQFRFCGFEHVCPIICDMRHKSYFISWYSSAWKFWGNHDLVRR